MEFPVFTTLPDSLRIREYNASDFDACVSIYRSNTESLPDTMDLFIDHLSGPFSYYLVIESPSGILACGGIDIRAERNSSCFTFGMVRRDFHRRGLGTLLVFARLALLDDDHDPAFVFLDTSVAAEPFYQRFGFERSSPEERRYPGGSYYINMKRSLPLQERDVIRNFLTTLQVIFEVAFPNGPHA